MDISVSTASAVRPEQLRTIYTIGNRLGIVDRSGGKEDELHELVACMTGRVSVKSLTDDMADTLIAELRRRERALPKMPCKEQCEEVSGGASAGQQKKIWRLVYTLRDLDRSPGSAPIGERLCGIIHKELEIDATIKEPFRWVDFEMANRLIEALKGYVTSAKRGAKRGDSG